MTTPPICPVCGAYMKQLRRGATLARRDGVKVYELVAQALDLYDRLNSPRNGNDQDSAQ